MSEWIVFGERLKWALKERKMSYRELAEKVGLSVPTICRYVHCQRVPKATELLKIANVLGVNCNYLLGVIDEPYRDCPYTPKQPAEPERLTDDDFETIRIHLNALKERLCNQRRWKEAEEYQRIIDRFMSFASAEPQKKGKWIGYNSDNSKWQRDDGSPIFLICSECGKSVLNNGSAYWNFCPNCGSYNGGEQE